MPSFRKAANQADRMIRRSLALKTKRHDNRDDGKIHSRGTARAYQQALTAAATWLKEKANNQALERMTAEQAHQYLDERRRDGAAKDPRPGPPGAANPAPDRQARPHQVQPRPFAPGDRRPCLHFCPGSDGGRGAVGAPCPGDRDCPCGRPARPRAFDLTTSSRAGRLRTHRRLVRRVASTVAADVRALHRQRARAD